MIQGSFVEQPTDVHVKGRAELLRGGTRLSEPEIRVRHVEAGLSPADLGPRLLADLRECGLAARRFGTPLSDEDFLELGALLGDPMPERDPTVRPYVDREVILNLVAEHGHTEDTGLAPFASNYLSLHSEGRGRPADEQPRYIVLMCCEPGDDATSAQTVLVPMAEVARRLTADRAEILARTRYLGSERGPMMLRTVDGRPVFSFRDFMGDALKWHSVAEGADPDTVNETLRELLAAMYSPGTLTGVRWRRGMLVVLDNTFFFHGRTAGSGATATRNRHLKRLRIVHRQPVTGRTDAVVRLNAGRA